MTQASVLDKSGADAVGLTVTPLGPVLGAEVAGVRNQGDVDAGHADDAGRLLGLTPPELRESQGR